MLFIGFLLCVPTRRASPCRQLRFRERLFLSCSVLSTFKAWRKNTSVAKAQVELSCNTRLYVLLVVRVALVTWNVLARYPTFGADPLGHTMDFVFAATTSRSRYSFAYMTWWIHAFLARILADARYRLSLFASVSAALRALAGPACHWAMRVSPQLV